MIYPNTNPLEGGHKADNRTISIGLTATNPHTYTGTITVIPGFGLWCKGDGTDNQWIEGLPEIVSVSNKTDFIFEGRTLGYTATATINEIMDRSQTYYKELYLRNDGLTVATNAEVTENFNCQVNDFPTFIGDLFRYGIITLKSYYNPSNGYWSYRIWPVSGVDITCDIDNGTRVVTVSKIISSIQDGLASRKEIIISYGNPTQEQSFYYGTHPLKFTFSLGQDSKIVDVRNTDVEIEWPGQIVPTDDGKRDNFLYCSAMPSLSSNKYLFEYYTDPDNKIYFECDANGNVTGSPFHNYDGIIYKSIAVSSGTLTTDTLCYNSDTGALLKFDGTNYKNLFDDTTVSVNDWTYIEMLTPPNTTVNWAKTKIIYDENGLLPRGMSISHYVRLGFKVGTTDVFNSKLIKIRKSERFPKAYRDVAYVQPSSLTGLIVEQGTPSVKANSGTQGDLWHKTDASWQATGGNSGSVYNAISPASVYYILGNTSTIIPTDSLISGSVIQTSFNQGSTLYELPGGQGNDFLYKFSIEYKEI